MRWLFCAFRDRKKKRPNGKMSVESNTSAADLTPLSSQSSDGGKAQNFFVLSSVCHPEKHPHPPVKITLTAGMRSCADCLAFGRGSAAGRDLTYSPHCERRELSPHCGDCAVSGARWPPQSYDACCKVWCPNALSIVTLKAQRAPGFYNKNCRQAGCLQEYNC